jgi:hypothetical protein
MTDFGATGKFPEGKLNEDDEGELRFGIAGDPEKGMVYIDFGKPVTWMAMRPERAEALAEILIRHARKARG